MNPDIFLNNSVRYFAFLEPTACIVTTILAGRPRKIDCISGGVPEIYLSSKATSLVPEPNRWLLEALKRGTKRRKCETDHLSLTRVEVKNERSYTSTLAYDCMVSTGTLPLPFQ
jgi:hypothetical protein